MQTGITRVKQPGEKALKAALIIQHQYKKRVGSKPASDYLRGKHLRVQRNIRKDTVTLHP